MDLSNIQITQECLKSIANFGETIYKNVCNGTMSVVPWGTVDWIGAIVIGVILGGAGLFILLGLILVFRMIFSYY